MIIQKIDAPPARGLQIVALVVLGIATAALGALFIAMVAKYPEFLGGMI